MADGHASGLIQILPLRDAQGQDGNNLLESVLDDLGFVEGGYGGWSLADSSAEDGFEVDLGLVAGEFFGAKSDVLDWLLFGGLGLG